MFAPKSLKEYLSVVKNIDKPTYIIAGGTDLIIHLNHSREIDYNIIDITKIEGLNEIKEDEEFLSIGALVTMTELCESELIKNSYKALYQAAYELGSNIIRNRATLGGNVSNASQSADCSLVLFSYDAKIKVLRKNGNFEIFDIDKFVVGKEKTILEQGDLLVEILIPKTNFISCFKKVGARKAVTISKVSISFSSCVENNRFVEPTIYLGAVGVKPTKATYLMEYFKGKSLEEIDLKTLQEISFDEVERAIPNRSSKYYKRVAIQGLIENVIGDLI